LAFGPIQDSFLHFTATSCPLPLLPELYLLSGSYILVSEWCGDVGSIGSDDYLLDGRRVFSRDCAN